MSVAATVKGGGFDLWGSTMTLQRGVSSLAKLTARIGNVKELRKDRRLELTLLGVVAGSTATETLKHIKADATGELGGKRTIETENLVNRVTTSGDVTDLTNRYLIYASRPTYPVNKATKW